jgi:hypothetical protein
MTQAGSVRALYIVTKRKCIILALESVIGIFVIIIPTYINRIEKRTVYLVIKTRLN